MTNSIVSFAENSDELLAALITVAVVIVIVVIGIIVYRSCGYVLRDVYYILIYLKQLLNPTNIFDWVIKYRLSN